MLANPDRHLSSTHHVTAQTDGCEECLKRGMQWVHLRVCLSCGHVGCCDNSVGKHATQHFHTTNHPIVESYEPGEDWGWCYVDESFIELPRDLLVEKTY
jgi:uncharacterized UBP type Zn finger protein